MKPIHTRRSFLKTTGLTGAGLAVATAYSPRLRSAVSPNEIIHVGVMGTNGRGMAHIDSFTSLPNVEIDYVCDVDRRAVDKAIAAVKRRQERAPKGVDDFRRILDDPGVDVLSIAAPNHWHAPATILACAAGKHVYVEKPGSHNARESEWIVAAARKFGRVVQMGNQRRSWPWVIETMAEVHKGAVGEVYFARTWYNNLRPTIGRGNPAAVPEWLNYELWQGPAPARPFKDNVVHYNWHWRWHWGGGELANNGIHALDLARWGLEVDYPCRVTCGGSRYHYRDDQETPDTCVATYDFGDKGAMWEGHSCDPRGFEGEGFGCTFYGSRGTVVIAGNKSVIYDPNNKVLREIAGKWNDTGHFANFLDCVRTHTSPNSDIADAQKSTLLCHLGNIAYRTGHTLDVDPNSGRVMGDPEAMELWGREYQPGWEPKL